MLLTDEEIESPILLAALVLELQIEAVHAGPWQPEPPRFETCVSEVRFRLLQILKDDAGALLDVAGSPGDALERRLVAQITQSRSAGSRYIGVPGVWSGHELVPGARLVIFSSAAGADLAAALDDSHCLGVEPSETALADTRRALPPPQAAVPIGALLSACAPQRHEFGALFAGYVVDRVIETFFDDREGFEQVLATATDATLAPPVALILLRGVGDALLRHEPAPNAFLQRFVMAAALVAVYPGQAALRPILLQIYLPNLLGVTGGLGQRPASAIFATDVPARATVRDLLAQALPEAAALLPWIDG